MSSARPTLAEFEIEKGESFEDALNRAVTWYIVEHKFSEIYARVKLLSEGNKVAIKQVERRSPFALLSSVFGGGSVTDQVVATH